MTERTPTPFVFNPLVKNVLLAARGAGTVNHPGFAVYRTKLSAYLHVTAAATEVSDTLNVTIQYSYDNVTFFAPTVAAAFTQVLGNGGVKNLTIVGHVAEGLFARFVSVIVDPGVGVASFTFQVDAMQHD